MLVQFGKRLKKYFNLCNYYTRETVCVVIECAAMLEGTKRGQRGARDTFPESFAVWFWFWLWLP